MMTNYKSILLFLLAAFMGALGQYLYKTGAEQSSGNLILLVSNFRVLLGILCYLIIMVLFLFAFKLGGALTVLYPVYATTFIWALLIGFFFLGEKVTLVQIIGVLLIVLGVYLIAR
ncbi:hypothetical protein BXT86_05185 [candidate division WOR-3 bacterium 4484_100]|uniref:EamA domain-containing protein n=1 Tax=candidate division WOR-3 bacterium 4484_100 TaxID=1936077 RepID=A0A1V4QEC0_UNCW3|nr:MAG: hypothetical protein BXT86_05185 [candidate division WOR-3 bacterium 4484_100]